MKIMQNENKYFVNHTVAYRINQRMRFGHFFGQKYNKPTQKEKVRNTNGNFYRICLMCP